MKNSCKKWGLLIEKRGKKDLDEKEGELIEKEQTDGKKLSMRKVWLKYGGNDSER